MDNKLHEDGSKLGSSIQLGRDPIYVSEKYITKKVCLKPWEVGKHDKNAGAEQR